jgi:hypothetical protein
LCLPDSPGFIFWDRSGSAGGVVAVGVNYYFTPSISVLTGPVWFNEKAVNGEWKWTIQLDVNLPGFGQ